MRIHWLKLNCQEQKEQKNTKGQLVSKRPFWCLQIFQKTNKFFSRISALAFKKRSSQKSSVKDKVIYTKYSKH